MHSGSGLAWRPSSTPLVVLSCALELALMLWIGMQVTQRLEGYDMLCSQHGRKPVLPGRHQGLAVALEACGTPLLQPYASALKVPRGANKHDRAASDQAVRDLAKLASRPPVSHLPASTNTCLISTQGTSTTSTSKATTPAMCSSRQPEAHWIRHMLACAWHYANPKTLWDLGETTIAVRELHLLVHIILALCFPRVYVRRNVRAVLFISDRLTTWLANVPALLFARGPHIALGTALFYSLARRRSGVLFVSVRALTTCVPLYLQIWVAPAEWLVVLIIMTLVDKALYGHVVVDAQQALTAFLAVAVVPTAITWMYEQHKLRYAQPQQQHRQRHASLPPPHPTLSRISTDLLHKASTDSFNSTSSVSAQPGSGFCLKQQGLGRQAATGGTASGGCQEPAGGSNTCCGSMLGAGQVAAHPCSNSSGHLHEYSSGQGTTSSCQAPPGGSSSSSPRRSGIQGQGYARSPCFSGGGATHSSAATEQGGTTTSATPAAANSHAASTGVLLAHPMETDASQTSTLPPTLDSGMNASVSSGSHATQSASGNATAGTSLSIEHHSAPPAGTGHATEAQHLHTSAAMSGWMYGSWDDPAPASRGVGGDSNRDDGSVPHTRPTSSLLMSNTGPASLVKGSTSGTGTGTGGQAEPPAASEPRASGHLLSQRSSVRTPEVQVTTRSSHPAGATGLATSLSWRGRTRAVPVSIKVAQHPGDFHGYASHLRASALHGPLSHTLTRMACPTAHPGTARVVAATCVRGCVQLLAFVHGLQPQLQHQERLLVQPGSWDTGGLPESVTEASDLEHLLLDGMPGPTQVVGGLQMGGALEGMRAATLRILYVDPVVASSSTGGCTFMLGVSAPAASAGSLGSSHSTRHPARIVVASGSKEDGGEVADAGNMTVLGLLAEQSIDLQPGFNEVPVHVPCLPGPAEGDKTLQSLIIWLLPVIASDAAGHAQPLPSVLSTAVVPVLPPGPPVAEMQRLWDTMQQEFSEQQQQQGLEQSEEGELILAADPTLPLVLTTLSTTTASTTSPSPLLATGEEAAAPEPAQVPAGVEVKATVFREHWQGLVQDLVWVAAQVGALHSGPDASTGPEVSQGQVAEVRRALCEYLTDQGLHTIASLIHCPARDPAPASQSRGHEEGGHTGGGDSGNGQGAGPFTGGFHDDRAHLHYFSTNQQYLHDGTPPSPPAPAPGVCSLHELWFSYPPYQKPDPAKCITVPLFLKPSQALEDRLALYRSTPQARCLMAHAVSIAAAGAALNTAASHGLASAWPAGVSVSSPEI